MAKVKSRVKVIRPVNVGDIYQRYRFLIWFFGGIILGTFLMNFFCGYFYDRLGVYTTYFMDTFKQVEVPKNSLFWYSVKNMALETLIVLAVAFTSIGSAFTNLYCCYKGVSIALLISAYVLKFGVGGVLIYVLSVFPHYITYGFMLWLVISFAGFINISAKNVRKSRYMGESLKNSVKNFLIELFCERKTVYAIIWIAALMIFTAFLEAYVNYKFF